MIFRGALVWPTSRCDLRISLSTVRSSILLQSFVAAADLVVASLLSIAHGQSPVFTKSIGTVTNKRHVSVPPVL